MNPQPVTPAAPTFKVVVQPSGLCFDAPAGTALLTSARLAGVVLPSSCRNGTCRSCLCSLASGRVGYLIDWPGLSAEEKHEGLILPCVAVPESDLVLDAPGARPAAAG